ncbi:hypothetical protein LXA43DRAFT_896148 [Ganoderma leucocontextum]|nr:hypothetical protein LXA43DRAFT_896148 [Ganoderma leucocontextum]
MAVHKTDLSEFNDVYEALLEATTAFTTFTNSRDHVPVADFIDDHEIRLWRYPIQFSVDGAFTVTVTIPASSIEALDCDVDILRDLAFFETSDRETSSGNVQLHLPLLLIKKRAGLANEQASVATRNKRARVATTNEQRIATASAAWFLAHLGIKDFPIFSLVTCGEKGYLSQAWFSTRDECCYVADCNIRRNPFDLGAGDLRYKAFLSKLKDHAKELESRFEGAREQLLVRAMGDGGSTLRWSARAQLAEYEEAGWAIE